MSTMAERRKLARLYLIVAAVNDYRLTVSPLPSWDDLTCAQDELITLDNAQNNARPVTNLALDLIEMDIKRSLRGTIETDIRASKGNRP